MTIKDKILSYIKERGVSREDFYRKTGLSASNFKGAALKSELGGDKIVRILTIYNELSPDWLLLDKGSMLRADEAPTNSVIPSTEAPAASVKPDESILYNMYKDLQAEKKEKESEIKELNAKICTMSEEIGRLKAQLSHRESREREHERESETNAISEVFTDKSSGDFGEGFLPTKQPVISKNSSVGKI